MSSVPRRIYELFDKYGKMMASQPYPLGAEARLILDTEHGVYGTKKGANMGRLKWSDIVKMADGHMSNYKTGMVARVVSQTPYCQQCLREGVEFQAVLDDMAMIIGPEAVIVNMTGNNRKRAARDMAKAAVKGSGFFVQDRIVDGLPAGYTLTMGRNFYEAVSGMAILEKCAEIALKSRAVGGVKPVSRFAAKNTRLAYLDTYSAAETRARAEEMKDMPAAEKTAAEAGVDELADYELEFYGLKASEEEPAEEPAEVPAEEPAEKPCLQWDEAEAEARQKLVDCGNKMVETGLVQGTWGNLSIRLDERFMLVTPSGLDYSRLTAEDMVKVDLGTMACEGSLKPTSEKGLHAEIYRRRPDIGAVVHTHSRYCSIFAAAHADLDLSGASEDVRRIFGLSVRTAKYAKAGTDKLARFTADAMGSGVAAFMANHGMTVCGSNMDEAFANAQLLEKAAEDWIESRLK